MKRLEKNIGFWGIFALATGSTLSGGFFLLPGLAAIEVGPAIVLVYLIACIPLIPALFSQIELATAIPRAGGFYFFIDRTLGPYFGTVGGLGTWLALVLKVSFALIGIGAYLRLFFPAIEIVPIAAGIAVLLGIINLFGSKKSGSFQVILFFCLSAILIYFISGGISEINTTNFNGIWDNEISSLFSTAGFVFMSYIGITKIISLAEEIKKPERNLPLGIFWALGTSLFIYVLGLIIMVGVVPMEELAGSFTPVAAAAEAISGKVGVVLVSFAALFSFLSVANAGILSASRYPFAMSRDHLLPRYFRKTDSKGNPYVSLLLTVGSIIFFVVAIDPTMIAKLASAFLLLIFAVLSLSVIVMRESRIESYDPGFHSPLYPWMQIFGIFSAIFFIFEMGLLPFLFSLGLIIIGTVWYVYYAKGKVLRTGAIYNIFERLGKYKYAGVDYELRDMMKKKGLKKEDPFDEIVAKSMVIDNDGLADFEEIAAKVSDWVAKEVGISAKRLHKEFMDGTRIGATPVIQEIALPHLIIEGLKHPKMVLVRSNEGVRILYNNPRTDFKQVDEVLIKAVFFLVSPKNNPAQHLRILARIARRVEENSFLRDWNNAKNEHELKIALLHYERFLFLKISKRDETIEMSGKALKDVWTFEGSLVAWIKRDDDIIIPDGATVVSENDLLTIIGDPESLNEIVNHYHLIRANYFE
ncbi:MAG: amino acid permease [Bacteroidetes bacterium]|nr:amino acid permease [Bacteroidota bacterium]